MKKGAKSLGPTKKKREDWRSGQGGYPESTPGEPPSAELEGKREHGGRAQQGNQCWVRTGALRWSLGPSTAER